MPIDQATFDEVMAHCLDLERENAKLKASARKVDRGEDFFAYITGALGWESPLVSNYEFSLHYLPGPKRYKNKEKLWLAMLGNPARGVMLGEVEGDVQAWGSTPLEASQRLMQKITNAGVWVQEIHRQLRDPECAP